MKFRYFFSFFLLIHLGLLFYFAHYEILGAFVSPNTDQGTTINVSFDMAKVTQENQVEAVEDVKENIKEDLTTQNPLIEQNPKPQKPTKSLALAPNPKPMEIAKEEVKEIPKKKLKEEPKEKSKEVKRNQKKQSSSKISKPKPPKEETKEGKVESVVSFQAPTQSENSSLGKIYSTNFVKFNPPIYPPRALRRSLEGKVIIQVLISPKGLPLETKIISSSNDIFNQAAINSAMKSTYNPILRNTIPVQAWISIPITFALR